MATLIVPAAGEGTRLSQARPKALVDLGGRPLIDWVLAAASGSADHLVVVIRPQQQDPFDEWASRTPLPAAPTWAFQDVPTGSWAAVRIGVERARQLGWLELGVVIVWSDQVGVGAETVKALSAAVATDRRLLAVPVCQTSSPYVWIETDDSGRISRVRRVRDGDAAPSTALADLGVFGLSESLATAFLELPEYPDEIRGGRESDFTYALPTLSALADVTLLPRAAAERELIAVNTAEDLARARERLGGGDD